MSELVREVEKLEVKRVDTLRLLPSGVDGDTPDSGLRKK